LGCCAGKETIVPISSKRQSLMWRIVCIS